MNRVVRIIHSDSAGGICLLITAILGVIAANSPFAHQYFELLEFHIGPMPLLEWVNDALMAIFFLFVGIEIKREMICGELNTNAKRFLPVIAACAGVLTPAAVYYLIAGHDPAFVHGWGIPTATDIAFAIGVMTMLGDKVPSAMKAFLSALAVIDDLIAIIVIAIFYGGGVSFQFLLYAAIVTAVLVYLNKNGYVRPVPYVVLGFVLWYCVLKSGIHATIAGVILAMTLPATGVHQGKEVTPMADWDHALDKWVTFLIIPLFAFFNTGVSFGDFTVQDLFHPVVFGVIFGFLIGKQLGIFTTVYALVKAGAIKMPNNTKWIHVYGTSLVCGIGFTMSLFVAALAFDPGIVQERAKVGIFIGSILSGVIGYAVLELAHKFRHKHDKLELSN